MDEAKEGLQVNNNKDGQAPDSENTQEGSELASLDADLNGDGVAEEAIEEGGFVDPYPQVLPDVPEEILILQMTSPLVN